MKKLGILYNRSREGLLLIKTKIKNPEKLVGAIVYSEDMKRVGRITDIIGRVDEPYIVVKPESLEFAELLEKNSILYYYIPRRRGKRRGRGRKKKKH